MAIALDNIKTLDELLDKLNFIRQEAGKNLPLNISVLHEPKDLPFGTFYEDRQLATHMEVVKTDSDEFLELYI